MGSPQDFIDTDRYPIHRPGTSAYDALVAHCRTALETQGACLLHGFAVPEAVACMATETDRVVERAYLCRDTHTVYLNTGESGFPEDHPRRRLEVTELYSVACDQIASEDALKRVYHWDPLLFFLADVLQRRAYYRMADPLAALTINVMRENQNHGWHFDEAQVTTTLMIQAPEQGGRFQYVHNLRTEDEREYEGITQVLDGTHPGIRTLDIKPGTLSIFAGYYSLHRVTPVAGGTTRYLATFCFKDRPGVKNSPEVQKLFYGRTA